MAVMAEIRRIQGLHHIVLMPKPIEYFQRNSLIINLVTYRTSLGLEGVKASRCRNCISI